MTKREAKKLQVDDIVLVRKNKRPGRVVDVSSSCWSEHVLVSIMYDDTNKQVWKRHRQIARINN